MTSLKQGAVAREREKVIIRQPPIEENVARTGRLDCKSPLGLLDWFYRNYCGAHDSLYRFPTGSLFGVPLTVVDSASD